MANSVREDFPQFVRNYKKKLSGNFFTLTPDKIDQYLNGDNFHVTRKYDGQLAVLFFDGETVSAYNSGGNEYPALPCVGEAAACLKKAKVKEAILAAELYTDESKGRTRVFHSLAAVSDAAKQNTLRLAPFDIISFNGEEWDVFQKGGSYGDTHKKLSNIFNEAGAICAPVRYSVANSRDAVKKLFDDWVTGEGSEGLVV